MASDRVSARLRAEVERRAGGCCEYCRCQSRFSSQSFCAEHIEPRSLGGKTELSNLAYSCQSCNNHKYNKVVGVDPVSKQVVMLFHPRRDQWREHFAWSDDFRLILGLTATGRATVETLNLNKPGLVRLRGVLLSVGEHPPPSE